MDDSTEGPCCVCGVTTTHRCFSCAQHGFDLFLCGREHQKLIWFAHKRYCGENSRPFRFPPLSEKEAEAIKEMAYSPIQLYTTTSRLADEIMGAQSVTDDPLLYIDYLKDPPTTLPGVPDNAIFAELNRDRMMLYTHIVQTCKVAQVGPQVCAVSFSAETVRAFDPHLRVGNCADSLNRKIGKRLAASSATLEQQRQAPFPVHEQWYCAFFHSLVVFSTLQYRQDKLRILTPEYVKTPPGEAQDVELQAYLETASVRLREALEPLRLADDWRYPLVEEVVKMVEVGSGVGSDAK